MSIINLLPCGFAKVYCYNTFTEIKNSNRESMGNPKHNQSQVLKERYQLFLEQFAREIHRAETYTSFSDTFKKIVPHLQSLGKNILIKRTYYLIFFLLKNRVI